MKKLITKILLLNGLSILMITNPCFSNSFINSHYNLIDGKIAFSVYEAKLPVSEKVKRHLKNFSPLNIEPISLQNDFVIRRKVDFNNHPIGLYSNTQYRSDWNGRSLYQPNTTRIQLVDGKKVLANYYPKGTWGRGGGLNQFSNLDDSPDDIEEIYVTYNIKFEKSFDWGIVGKLPGFSFGNVQTVAAGGDGPNIGNKGSSLRLVWDRNGKIKLYAYHHNMKGKYGDDMGVEPFGQFIKGKWHELTLRVVRNDIGKANGIMQVWLDGSLEATATNIEMRTSSSPKTIREFILGTFMGGSDSRFAPKLNQYMWMDDFHVWQYSKEFLNANPSIARGLKLHSNSHDLYTPLSDSRNEIPSEGFTVTVKRNPSQGGDVKFDLDKTDYSVGEKVFLTAIPNSGFKFSNWTIDGKIVGKDLEYEFSMPNKNRTVVANFYKETSTPPVFPESNNQHLLDGLVAFYEMNSNNSGKLMDSHGQNHGSNIDIEHVNGFINKGNYYDGTSAISNVPHHPSLNMTDEFTLMADVFREGNGQSGTSIIVGKGNGNRYYQEYSLGITPDDNVRIRALLPGLTDWVSEATVPKGKWVRIIATYKSGEGYRLYMDDIQSEASPRFTGTVSKSGKKLFVGSNTTEGNGNAASNRRFNGKLDNVGIWNRELFSEEIETLITDKITYPDFGEQKGAYRIINDNMEYLADTKLDKLITEEALLQISNTSDNPDVLLEYIIGPNPATDFLNIIFANLDGDYDFEIKAVSMDGNIQKVYKSKAQNSTITIDVSDLRPGIYILVLDFNGRTISSRKFIKK